ncbi:hypothetical protein [Lichenibacterium ramalinae]|uniref:DUF2125 domain-containing protein n=1 Tax=Lichenibacterium ramalinae TaxID=2316527 RepID=A0A4Q2RI44_9HYPH|nr:hypothetical protein [Lichenibacterium ramalinae]RYB07676.1 hypothetical protein D3272_00650 [Lichenibacterium ramalinae]
MARTLLIGLAVAAIPIVSAAAAPATPEEAARLTALFERYVSHPAPGQPSGVSVVPAGESYAVTVDVKRAAAGLDSFGITFDPYTSKTLLTPQPDGTWKVHGDDSPPMVVHAGNQTLSFAATSSSFDGVYDPKLRTFASFDQHQAGTTTVRTSPTLDQNTRSETATWAGTGVAAEGGTVTTTAHYAATGFASDIMLKAAPAPAGTTPGNPAVPPPSRTGTAITVTAPSSVQDVSLGSLRAGALLDLWAFVVAHPTHDSLVAAQDDLKGLLRAGLPYVDSLKLKATLPVLAASTPVGVVSTKSFAAGIDASGLAATGRAAVALSLSDLAVPPGQLPPWSSGLVPTALDLHVTVDGFHAAEAALATVNAVDLAKDVVITPDQKAVAGRALWPGNGTVTLAPSRLTTAMLDLRMDGQASFAPAFAGRVTVTGTGLDKEIAALQALAATDPGAGQVLGPLVLAKNLAKPNPDGSLGWLIEFGGGPVKINGAPLQ